MINSKNKGSTFERKIANLFSNRFSTYLGIPSGFYRNPGSGAYWGGANSKKIDTHSTEYALFGDLVCPKSFKFSIECKHYKEPPSFNSLLKSNVPQWDDWIKQSKFDADNANKIPIIILKYNNVKELLIIDNTFDYIEGIILYKNYKVGLLETFLQLPDNVFFEEQEIYENSEI